MTVLRRTWLWLVALAALLAIAAACGGGNEASPTASAGGSPSASVGPGVSDTEIKLGMTNDLAGVGKTPYAPITAAIQAYFKKVNAEDKGVCGRNVTLVAEDDQYSPSVALDQTKKLVEQENVLAIVGALGTAAHLGVVDYLNQNNVPDLFVSSGYSGWGNHQKWPWTIGFIPDYVSDSTIQTRFINDNFPNKKVGILYQNDDFGKDYLNGLQKTIKDQTLLVSQQSYEATATDVTSQILNIKNAGAEVVMLAATPRYAAMAIVAAHTQNYNAQFTVSNVSAPTSLASLIGGGTDAASLQKGFAQQAGDIGTNYLMDPIADAAQSPMVEHKRVMQTYGGPSVSALSVYGQTLAETVIEALSKSCDNLNRPGLMKGAESIQGFAPSLILPGIKINLSATDHYAIQALQPVKVAADGTLTAEGAVISLE